MCFSIEVGAVGQRRTVLRRASAAKPGKRNVIGETQRRLAVS